jgi:acyl-CoA synthetase (AMP-forming)/AMP-acid ligase II
VDPEKHVALEPGRIGEIWIAGGGKCLGYWNNPELTLKLFHARLVDDSPYDDGYLRTGDMGFFHERRTLRLRPHQGHDYSPRAKLLPAGYRGVVEKASGLIRTIALPRSRFTKTASRRWRSSPR